MGINKSSMSVKKILLPTDFSSNARMAVDYAITLFGMEGEYTLLNLYHEPHAAATSMISLVDIAMQDSRNSLMDEMDYFKDKYGSELKMGYLSEYGEGGRQICMLANRYNQDVIIMGTKGASGLKEVLVGSVASDTINKSDKPVIVVPEGEWSKPTKICIAVDENPEESLFGFVRNIATEFNAVVSFVRVNSGDMVPATGKSADGQPEFIRGEETFSEIYSEDAVEGITEYVEDTGTDMLVMFPGTHGFLDRLFKRSHTGKVAMHSKVPLMTIHK